MLTNNKRLQNMKTIKYIFLLCLLALQSAGIIVAQNTMQQPVDLGNKAFAFSYTDTKNTVNYTNDYWGQESNDVFYKFTLTRAMNISIDHCGSEVYDTYLHVLDSLGNEIFANDDDWEYQYCSNFYNSYLYLSNLPAGTYYVVSEGYWEDGNITTTINGICPLPATGLYDGSAVTGTANVGTNYILTITPTVATSDVSGLGVNESLQSVQYFDGLGRPIQTVQRGITPSKQDLATLTEYDGAGREQFQWLPKSHNGSGAFVEPTAFKGITQAEYGGDSRPYNEAIIEPSPLNRVLGNKGPGAAWENKPTTIAYDANTATDAVAYYSVNASNNLVRGNNYTAGSLYKTVSKDEDNKGVTEFKDKLGQVVMKRNDSDVDTYFVYNDLGQLSYVIPPLLADDFKILTENTVITDDNVNLKKYGYLYKYDERGNCIYKRLPGCTPIYMIYDKADRLVLSQDGNQRNKKSTDGKRMWTATKYDVFGRVIYMGTMSRTETDSTTNYKLIRDIFVTELVVDGYTANNFGSCTPLTENYYDSYDFINTLTAPIDKTKLNFITNSNYGAQHNSAKGLLTGTRTYYLDGSGKCSATAMYYDYRGRVVQTRASNHLEGYDITYNQYNFSGQVTQSLKEHNTSTQSLITELYKNEYDHAGRLLKTKYKMNEKPEVTLVDNSASDAYDELGRLRKKKRHNGTDSEEFDYNIRNWTTRIKSGTFEEKLYYNTNPTGFNSYFNGNISYQTWTYNGQLKGYTFEYDNLNRLIDARYALNNEVLEDFYSYEEWYNYDKMGNIKQLTRNHGDDTMDQLFLTYNGNQLKNVWDGYGSQNQYNLKEYQDKAPNGSNTSVEEMAYDANGNLTKDLDRDIVTIKYNLLNLPEIIQFKNGNQIRNLYDASGQKLQTKNITICYGLSAPITEGDILTSGIEPTENEDVYVDGKDYCGNYEYYLGSYFDFGSYQPVYYNYLDKVYNPEGYMPYGAWDVTCNYYRRDHLGNIREVGRTALNSSHFYVAQRTQYYPSGLPWATNYDDNPGAQNKKYNGKEFVEMHGYDTYDIVWRQYYPAIGRFQTPDPEVEQFYDLSPYSMCGNNMVMNVDPDGRVVETAWDVYSLVTGVASFAKNVATGNVGGAIIDGVGIVADAAAVLAPGVPGGAGVAIKAVRVGDKVVDAVKTGKTAEKVAEGGRAGKTIVKENGVKVKSYGTNDAHKPAHAHVKGGGKEVRVGANGKPLKGQPELSDKQKKVIDNNRKEIRKEVNAVGKENKKIEEQNQRR
jgi:RHS repeat-associated protein